LDFQFFNVSAPTVRLTYIGRSFATRTLTIAVVEGILGDGSEEGIEGG